MSFLARSLDRAIAAVSPQRRLERAVARLRLGIAQGLVERRGAGRTGGYRNWWPRVTNRGEETLSREALAMRAKDLAANDGLAGSAIRTLWLNVVGKGLTPQSQPRTEVLGLGEKEAQAFARQAEWAWGLWAKEADASGRLSFAEIQRLDLRTAGVLGEALKFLVFREPGPGRSRPACLKSNQEGSVHGSQPAPPGTPPRTPPPPRPPRPPRPGFLLGGPVLPPASKTVVNLLYRSGQKRPNMAKLSDYKKTKGSGLRAPSH
ncbi:MAG: phage portal protein [Deltaproteobacteria bacterium]|nr:phage portal protein [Deltaproteobacteria bacterium]